MRGLIINFTPTGMIPTKEMTPHVQVSINEIVDDVLKAANIGITMVHLHARDENHNSPTYKKEIYAEIITKIRKYQPELIICVSLSGRLFNSFEKRSEVLELFGEAKPDMASLTLSSLNFNKQASINSPEMILALAEKMKELKIKPELEAFDAGMINYARYLIKKELLSPPYYFNLLLGNIACAQADLLHAGIMIKDLPENSYWSLAGIGDNQLMMNTIAIANGGGVRVGLEDNIWYDTNRNKLATNQNLLKRVHRIAQELDRTVMPPGECRKLLKLNNGIKEGYGLKE